GRSAARRSSPSGLRSSRLWAGATSGASCNLTAPPSRRSGNWWRRGRFVRWWIASIRSPRSRPRTPTAKAGRHAARSSSICNDLRGELRALSRIEPHHHDEEHGCECRGQCRKIEHLASLHPQANQHATDERTDNRADAPEAHGPSGAGAAHVHRIVVGRKAGKIHLTSKERE